MIFNCIQDFVDHKKNCPFCEVSLIPRIIATGRTIPAKTKEIHEINALLTNGVGRLKIRHTSPHIDINIQCSISLSDNLFSFEENFDIHQLLEFSSVFENMYAFVYLNCENHKCPHEYYCISTVLKCYLDSQFGLRVSKISLDMECFSLSQYWIWNDYLTSNAKIYRIDDHKQPPINIPFLELKDSNKDKLFNKIKTFINFS